MACHQHTPPLVRLTDRHSVSPTAYGTGVVFGIRTKSPERRACVQRASSSFHPSEPCSDQQQLSLSCWLRSVSLALAHYRMLLMLRAIHQLSNVNWPQPFSGHNRPLPSKGRHIPTIQHIQLQLIRQSIAIRIRPGVAIARHIRINIGVRLETWVTITGIQYLDCSLELATLKAFS